MIFGSQVRVIYRCFAPLYPKTLSPLNQEKPIVSQLCAQQDSKLSNP